MKTAYAQKTIYAEVRQDKYADARVHKASDQPVTLSDSSRTSTSNTKSSRTQKRLRRGRLSQLASWVEDPIVFKVRKLARDKNLSMSKTLRRIIIQGLREEEGDLDQALDIESLQERNASDYRRLGRRLSWFLVWLIYDVGQIKVLANNTLGMQKGMTEALLKDILQDADRQTKARFSRKYPELSEFADIVEKWLVAEEERAPDPPKSATKAPNGERGRGGRLV